jgi:hypothetical protein
MAVIVSNKQAINEPKIGSAPHELQFSKVDGFGSRAAGDERGSFRETQPLSFGQAELRANISRGAMSRVDGEGALHKLSSLHRCDLLPSKCAVLRTERGSGRSSVSSTTTLSVTRSSRVSR